MSRVLFFLSICCFLAACKPKCLTGQELQKYVLDHDGLSKEKEIKGYKVQLSYKPSDLLVAQEAGGEIISSQKELDKLQSKYQAYDYFILSLSKDNKEALYAQQRDMGTFSELVQTLSFKMGQFVNETTSSKDTVELADYVFPRTYGMGLSTNLMFVFKREPSLDDEWLQVNIKEFGMGLGNQVFRFRREDLDQVPRIKFEIEK